MAHAADLELDTAWSTARDSNSIAAVESGSGVLLHSQVGHHGKSNFRSRARILSKNSWPDNTWPDGVVDFAFWEGGARVVDGRCDLSLAEPFMSNQNLKAYGHDLCATLRTVSLPLKVKVHWAMHQWEEQVNSRLFAVIKSSLSTAGQPGRLQLCGQFHFVSARQLCGERLLQRRFCWHPCHCIDQNCDCDCRTKATNCSWWLPPTAPSWLPLTSEETCTRTC